MSGDVERVCTVTPCEYCDGGALCAGCGVLSHGCCTGCNGVAAGADGFAAEVGAAPGRVDLGRGDDVDGVEPNPECGAELEAEPEPEVTAELGRTPVAELVAVVLCAASAACRALVRASSENTPTDAEATTSVPIVANVPKPGPLRGFKTW